ncbi:translocon-associated protein subunit gamma isoform X1 [Mesoplodon densirostris]|uniref:translocon-associated protein subunit gamma isoform X1 n=1 Tax=Mesoplodon densirostris TaxID=48708 RepID=UPI0028DBFD13|nr:translocon-associated protein subunit gamma isoform X1 [Mesoplodon densirostris]
MAPKGGSKQQSEEDLLLQDFSRNLSAKSSALFFGNAFIVSAIPIWLYWRIWHMDLIQSAVLYSVMTLVSTYLVAFAYKNVKFVLKHKVAQKREDAVSKEVTRKLSEADNRKMSRKEKDERYFSLCCTQFIYSSKELHEIGISKALSKIIWNMDYMPLLNLLFYLSKEISRGESDSLTFVPRILWKKNEVADYEATTFSIFYNNTLFLVLVIVASFFILKNFNPTVNYILSISASSGLIALLSTGSK